MHIGVQVMDRVKSLELKVKSKIGVKLRIWTVLTTTILIFSFFFFLFTLSAHAAEFVGKFSAIEGRVEVMRDGKFPYIIAGVGTVVHQSDIVITKSGSKAEITFRDNTVLHLAAKNELKIDEYLKNTQKQGQKVIARVVEMKGIAAAAIAGDKPRLLSQGAALFESDGIATGTGSYAVLVFSDGSRISLAENSRLAILAYRFDDRQRTGIAEIHHLSGFARVQSGAIAKQGPEYYRFVTPMGVLRPLGTGWDSFAGDAKQVADKGADAARETGEAVVGAVQDTASQAAQLALNATIRPIMETMSALMTRLRDNPPTTEAGWNDLSSQMTRMSERLHGALDEAIRMGGAAVNSREFKSVVGLALAAELQVVAVGASVPYETWIGGNPMGPAAYATLVAMVAGAKASTYQSESLALVGLSHADLDRVSSNQYAAHIIIGTEVGGYLESQGNAVAKDFFSKAEAAAEELRLRAIEDAQQAEEAAARAAEEAEQRAIEDEQRAAEEARDAEREATRLAAEAAQRAEEEATKAVKTGQSIFDEVVEKTDTAVGKVGGTTADWVGQTAGDAKDGAGAQSGKALQAIEQIRAAEREFARQVSDLRNALRNATNLSEAEKQRVLGALDEWSRLVGEEVARLTAEVMKNPNAQVALTSLKIMAIVVATVAIVIVVGTVIIPLAALTAVAHTAMTNPSVFEDVPASAITQATRSTDQAAEAMRAILAAMVEHGQLGVGEAQQFMATLGQTLAGQATQAVDNAAQAGRDIRDQISDAGQDAAKDKSRLTRGQKARSIRHGWQQAKGRGAEGDRQAGKDDRGSSGQDSQSEGEITGGTRDGQSSQLTPNVIVWDGSVEVAGHIIKKGEFMSMTTDGKIILGKTDTESKAGIPRPNLVKTSLSSNELRRFIGCK